MNDDRLATLEDELRHLRKDHRRRGRILMAVAMAGGALFLLAARSAPSVVRAERFELTDHNGAVRGVLATDRGYPTLELSDDDGGLLLLQVVDGQASVQLDGSALDPTADATRVAELPSDVPAESIDVIADPELGIRLSIPENEPYTGVMLDCPQSGFRALVKLENGTAWIPGVPQGEDCTAALRGAGFPGRAPVRAGSDLACDFRKGWLYCEPAPR